MVNSAAPGAAVMQGRQYGHGSNDAGPATASVLVRGFKNPHSGRLHVLPVIVARAAELLAELRGEGKVSLSGQRRWARRKPVASDRGAGDG